MKREGKRPALTARSSVSATARLVVRLAVLLLLAPAVWPRQRSEDLTEQSIEDLMQIKVTSVSKTEETLSKTAAAVFVITQEDIANSGALNIPDVLRMVPGVEVAQINANTWAISIRGFNQRFANKLLVLVDGRSVYTPSFGGVFWDMLDLPLENIERIEVIRGPGGSVWGANAVNGVINIITKKTSETHGGLVVGGGGNVEQGFGLLQFGGKAGTSTDFRAYTKYFNNDHYSDPLGLNGADGWHALRGGFRTDSTITPRDTLTFEGDIYTVREGAPTLNLPSLTSPFPVPFNEIINDRGGFLQGVWKRTSSPRSDTTLQFSYDHYARNDVVHDHRGIFDVSFQNHRLWGEKQDIVWGLEFLDSDSFARGSLYASLLPARLNTALFGTFIQDEITLLPDQLYLTVGTKLEHNHYTGFGLMPSIRAAWTPTRNQTVWASVSRALRTPSEVDAGVRTNAGGFTLPDGSLAELAFMGNPKINDESLVTYELGYRAALWNRVSFDFAAYYNDYDNLETVEPGTPFFESSPPPPHTVFPVTYQNFMLGETHGLEVAASWNVTHRWSLKSGYAFERIHMHVSPLSVDTTSAPGLEGASPVHSAQLRSHVDLGHRLSWDTTTYYVDRLKAFFIPSYTRLDSELSWRFREKASFSIVGQNLARDHHMEFVDVTQTERTTLVKRSAYAKLRWEF